MGIVKYLTSDNYTEYTDTTGELGNWVFGDYKGQVLINQIPDEDILFGQLCYRSDNGHWLLANASDANTESTSMLGICVASTLAGDDAKILTSGYVSEEDGGYLQYGNIGTPVFMDTYYGQMTYLAPSSAGNVVRLIGYTFWNFDYHPNSINILYFNPYNTWIEL